MATYISHSPAETEALGEAWGRAAQSGLVIGLSGDLGTGKTQLVKGLARGLGISTRVHSPSFALVNIYSGGRLRLFHLDLYRLDTREQILGAGLEEYLEPEGVAVVEWAERWFGPYPQHPTHSASFHSGRPSSSSSSFSSSSSQETEEEEEKEDEDEGPSELKRRAVRRALTPKHPPLQVTHHSPRITSDLIRWVRIECLSDTERRITYEDSGA